ncbi:MAG TPA: cytochrome c [Patescibacteria group bacterium]|nr:cytochrome c [Patescibacteria group bacterium]
MRALAILAALTVMASPALAQAPARPVEQRLPMEQLATGSYAARAVDGAKLSAQWCDSCHMVRGTGSDVAPPFAVIGAKRTPDEVRAFLAKPHGGMPEIDLSNEQISDVIAYMRSLVPPE